MFMLRLVACALLPGSGLSVLAQEIVIEKIEVIGHYGNALGTSDAASQGTVTAKLIANRPVLRAAEILEFVPGVVITQHSGGGKANQYFLRGFNLDHGTDFATFVAGMPVNMPTHAHGQGYSDLNFLIPELVTRIDYFKGPYFASAGDFASAGSARIELADTLPSSLADLTVGQRGYQRALFAGSPPLAGGTLLAALEAGHNDGPWRHPEDLRRWNGVLRYSRGTALDGWKVTAMGYESRWNATDQIPLRAVDSGLLDRFGTVNPSDGGETSRYSVSFDLGRSGAASAVDAHAYLIRSRLDLFSDFTYFLDDPLRGDQFEQAERRTVAGANVAYRWAVPWAGRDIAHSVGVQLRHDRIEPVGLYRTVERARVETTREDRVRESSAGLYYENTLRWSEVLRTLAGARYDRYRFDVRSASPENSGRTSAAIVSPKLGAVLGPWAKSELFANWGRGFHSNDARGATIRRDPSSGEPAERVTPLVRSSGAEIGLRVEPAPGLQSSIALWKLDLASELVFVGDAGTTQASRPSRRRGVEWNNHYALGPRLLVDLDVSVSRARFSGDDAAGDRIPGAVERVVSAGVALNDVGPWSGSVQVRHFGPRPLIEDNSVRSQATTLAYARVGYRLSPAWRLSLDVFNLFDRKASDIDYYYRSRLPGEPAAGVEDIHFHPVEPRTFRLTVSARFF
jgi:outer membrane receptor protein involved in Fe transport